MLLFKHIFFHVFHKFRKSSLFKNFLLCFFILFQLFLFLLQSLHYFLSFVFSAFHLSFIIHLCVDLLQFHFNALLCQTFVSKFILITFQNFFFLQLAVLFDSSFKFRDLFLTRLIKFSNSL